jgi:hypothetical protein
VAKIVPVNAADASTAAKKYFGNLMVSIECWFLI